jgi:anaerobic magnesium-protoporphyrin IX monomethyl ester cyclase
MERPKRIVLGATLSTIEPLGPLYLSEIARQEGWEPHVVLGTGPDFKEIRNAVERLSPEVLGFTQFTGNHQDTRKLFEELREEYPDMGLVIGGPHPTAAPAEVAAYADHVAFGEGFNALRRVLRGGADKGIMIPKLERFPIAYRDQFYRDSPAHRDSPIKNIITGTGCPFRCTYCWNANDVEDLEGDFEGEPRKFEALKKVLPSGRTFSKSIRPVEDIVKEADDIRRLAPNTEMLFFQDDIFGHDPRWLEEFNQKWEGRFPFHLMSRFEFLDPSRKRGRRTLDLLADSGCNGITVAIESADPTIRKEVLRRNTPQGTILDTMDYIAEKRMATRTFSMIGLPYGATSEPTSVGLEADLETLKLNADLAERTGLPTIAWASIVVPYTGTKLSQYTQEHGFFDGNDEGIEGTSYRRGSVLRFVDRWVGPGLREDTPGVWMNEEQEGLYLRQLRDLMCYFPAFAHAREGDELAREYLEGGDLTPQGLQKATGAHFARGHSRGGDPLEDPRSWLTPEQITLYGGRLEAAASYAPLASQLPEGNFLMRRFMDRGNFSPEGFNTAVRYHLYDRHLYGTEKGPYAGEAEANKLGASEFLVSPPKFSHAYPAKLNLQKEG